MNTFVYTAFLPSLNKSVKLKELSFVTYKQLSKLITNNNDQLIIDAFDNIIKEHCLDDISDITFLDKLIILLTIRAMCVQANLELTITHPENKKPYNLTFKIYDIIEKLDSIELFNELNNKTIDYGNLKIILGIPSQFYFKNNNDSICSLIKKLYINGSDCTENAEQVIDHLPANVYRDAKKHLNKIQNVISKLSLLSVKFNKQENNIEMTPSLFNKTTLDFLKLCYKRDLSSFYEVEYFLSSKLHISYDIISNSTLAELLLYVNLYKEEQANKEKAERRPTNSNPFAGPSA